MNPILSLESVASHFASWRANRQMREPTPISLQQQAVDLKAAYSSGKIVIALGINHSMLKRWSIQLGDNDRSAFIRLPMPEQKNDNSPSDSIATCEFPNGVRLTLAGDALNSDFLSQIYRLNSEVE